MRASIILIGPSKAGKTTLSKLLADKLGWPALDLDDLRWDYYAEIGYDAAKAKEIRQTGGIKALADYWKPFEIHAVERVTGDYPNGHVISFGAGHSFYDEPNQLQRAQAALASFPHVILLLPAPDPDESVRILEQRLRDAEPDFTDSGVAGIMEVNRLFVTHPSNHRLATHVIYTAEKTADAACQEIVQQIGFDTGR